MTWSTFISSKNDICELPHKLLNNLRLKILGKQEISGKSPNFIEWWSNAQLSCQNGSFVDAGKKLLKNRQTFSVVRYFIWKLELVSNILWLIVDVNQKICQKDIYRYSWKISETIKKAPMTESLHGEVVNNKALM